MKIRVNDVLPAFEVETVAGQRIAIPDRERFVHLQFRRFVGCPICNTHLGQIRKHADKIKNNGIREVIFFRSSSEDIVSFQASSPFDVVADPEKNYYRQFGVESSWLYWMSAKTLLAAFYSLFRLDFALKTSGGKNGLPADILVDTTGRVVAAKYGKSAYDQWSVDELLRLARESQLDASNKSLTPVVAT